MERKFAFIAEGDVFAVFTFNTEDMEESPDKVEMIMAGLASNPRVVEFPADMNIEEGWRHDGNGFIRPIQAQ